MTFCDAIDLMQRGSYVTTPEWDETAAVIFYEDGRLFIMYPDYHTGNYGQPTPWSIPSEYVFKDDYYIVEGGR
jgi:hypothetical protein